MRWPPRAGSQPDVRAGREVVESGWWSCDKSPLAQVYTGKYTVGRQTHLSQRGSAMTHQLEFTEAELLSTHEVSEPLIAGGVHCHGGFADDGTYVSPRTLHRVPAVEAWQAAHTATFGTQVLHAP